MDFDWFNWVLLPLLIFCSRLADVTLATLRHILVSKGYKKIVPFIGFFEVLIWLVAMRQVMNNLNNSICYIAWAAGFSTGTYVGMWFEEKLALGLQVIRVFTTKDSTILINAMREAHHGVTVIKGEGISGEVNIIFSIIARKNKPDVINLINTYEPSAFYSIEDIRNISAGTFTEGDNTSWYKRFTARKIK